jgi:ketosteroid isomerase-like protein
VLVGREPLLRAAADFASTVSDWRVDVEELSGFGGGRVLATPRVIATGSASGTPIAEVVWSVVTVRDGLIARIEDHRDPDEARRAAGQTGSPP